MDMARIALLISAGVLTLMACTTGDANQPRSSPSPGESRSGTPSALPSTAMASRFSAAEDCPVMAPNELPDGRPPGSRRPLETGARSFLDVWGHGKNRVVIGRGQEVVDEYDRRDRTFPRTGEPVVGRDGIERWVVAIGDPPLGQIAYQYLVGTCPYLIWTQSGLAWEDALAYAARLATRPEEDSPQSPQLVQDAQAPVASDLQRLAEIFVRYAVGDSASFPHRESVSMAIGGEMAMSVDDLDAALSNPEIWRVCPADWEVYGASSCPVNLLGPINDAVVNGTVLVYSTEYGEVTCAPTRKGPLPPGRLVVLRPSQEWRTCATDFALALVADEQGRLRHIDLTLSEP